jgi:hypothetical protein
VECPNLFDRARSIFIPLARRDAGIVRHPRCRGRCRRQERSAFFESDMQAATQTVNKLQHGFRFRFQDSLQDQLAVRIPNRRGDRCIQPNVLLLVGDDPNDQTLHQKGAPFYNACYMPCSRRNNNSPGTPCAPGPRGSVYRKFSRRIMSVFIASDCMYRIVLLSGETANPGLPLAGGFSKSNIGAIRWVGMSKKAIPGLVVVSR